MDTEHFVPKGMITYAESVQLIVRAFGYNLDTMRFAQQPIASKLYPNVNDNAWYANAYIIAHYNGLDIPADINPSASVTREQFANLLDQAFEKKAKLPMINIKMELKDDASISPGFQGSILRLVHYKIVQLDNEGRFNPQRELTRGESAAWIYNALKYIEGVKAPVQSENVTMQIDKVNEDINKVTLSREQKSTGGYSLVINSIQFKDNGHAVIQYSLKDPATDEMTLQVITVPTAVTYLPSTIEVELERTN